MAFIKSFTVVWMLGAQVLFAIDAAAFTGNFEITNLVVDCPSEVDSTSTVGSFLNFDFVDQDTPDSPLAHCCLDWAAGQTPAPLPVEGSCSDSSITACVPEGQYGGFQNITVNLAHVYEDDSVGQAPYNFLTKYAQLYLDYPASPDYECDMDTACCESCEGATITAVVTEATA